MTIPQISLVALVLVGCGAKTEAFVVDASSDAPASDSASDVATTDAAPLTCVDPSGGMPNLLKACNTNSDCAMRARQSDCCGSETVVGVRADIADAFATCEAERRKGLPLCDCIAQPTRAEDGREVSGFTTKVRCTAARCTTYVE